MKLDVQVCGRTVAKLYRERDEYVLSYLPDALPTDFVSLTMPVREQPWRWPRDLHPFFRQNLPEGYLLHVTREAFGSLLDGTDLSLLAVVGGMGIGRVTVTPEGAAPGAEMEPLHIEQLLKAENTATQFRQLVRRYARAAISGNNCFAIRQYWSDIYSGGWGYGGHSLSCAVYPYRAGVAACAAWG